MNGHHSIHDTAFQFLSLFNDVSIKCVSGHYRFRLLGDTLCNNRVTPYVINFTISLN